MAINYNPTIITNRLRISFDALNPKSYPGSGNTLFSLNNSDSATATSLTVTNDSTAGAVYDHNGSSSSLVFNLSPAVNHEVWSIMFWIRSTGLTPSDYRIILALDDTNSSHNYFYNFDTRQTTNSYVLGYQKDFSINSWYTYPFNTASQWDDQTWWCIGVSHNNTVFKHYVQGNLTNTQTQTRDVAGYGDIDQLRLNRSNSNTVYMGPVLFYDKILSDSEFQQNFNAQRGRFGV